MWPMKEVRYGAGAAVVAERGLWVGRRAGARPAEREAHAEAPFRTFETTSARVRTRFARASPAKQPNSLIPAHSSLFPLRYSLFQLAPSLILSPSIKQPNQISTKNSAPVRLELTTFRLTVGRCNQLSHGALIFASLRQQPINIQPPNSVIYAFFVTTRIRRA